MAIPGIGTPPVEVQRGTAKVRQKSGVGPAPTAGSRPRPNLEEPPMATVFTRILDGSLPGHVVWRDDRCGVFLSINPITDGHALVVPREEVDHWIDLAPGLGAHLFEVARTVGAAQARAFDAPRIGLEIAGFEVAHCHLHVLPIADETDLHLSRSARSVEPEVLAGHADAIRTALRELGLEPAS
jgi:histidine triad (HIT) family protein